MTDPLVADRYRLIRRIGVGGMGHVWLARDEVLRRNVAVKEVYLPDGLSDDEINELHLRTLREARAAARLAHPSVIRIYDVLQAGDRPWIVMEYVPSRSLAQVIMEDGPLPPHRVATIGLALLGALTAAHEAGVLHRDVKPGNVLLAEDGRIVLTDFGLAVFDDLGMQVTRAGVVHGSPQFIAPERAKDGTSTAATDFWSLGATLYAAVEGRSPYARGSSYATLAALATEPPDAPERAGDLKPLLAGLLRRNPRSRIAPAEAETMLCEVAGPGPIPRQATHDRSDEVPAVPAVTTEPARAPIAPNSLPIRNRRKYDDERGKRGSAAVPVSPGQRDAEVDTDRRMAQAWALATPGPLPILRTDPNPPPAARARHRRVLRLTLAAVLVAALAGLGGYMLTDRGSKGSSAGPIGTGPLATGPSTNPPPAAQWPCTPPVPGSTVPVPSSKPLFSGANGLVDGWIWYTDPDLGFQVAVQERMELLTGPGISCFYDSATTRVAGVLRSRGVSGQTPAKALQALLDNLQGGRGMPEFKLVNPPAAVLGIPQSAEVQFTYMGPRALMMHAAMRNFVDKTGVTYTVIWQATDLDWPTGESANYAFFWINFHRLTES
jgi:eukaryotic-like serine/threonine-protein kinase